MFSLEHAGALYTYKFGSDLSIISSCRWARHIYRKWTIQWRRCLQL